MTEGARRDGDLGEADLLRWAHALAGIARTGLGFTENRYERERFEEVLAVAGDILAASSRLHDPAAVVEEWMGAVGSGVAGYATPKVAIGAVVGDERGRLLLIQRSDSGVWLYPTGWADIGYSPAEVAVKEVHEETGVEAVVERLVGVFDGQRRAFSRIPLYSLVFSCRAVGGELAPHPLECLDAGWFERDALPEPLAGGGSWADLAFAAIGGHDVAPYFDPPRDEIWRAAPGD